MTTVVWHNLDDIWYEAGLDRGVLYPTDHVGVPWNGLVSVEESEEDSEVFEFYYDGVKRSQHNTSGTFTGSIEALTYPDEFLEFDGAAPIENVSGIFLDQQQKRTFHLSYRTLLGDTGEGLASGYRIHILYNLMTEPRSNNRETLTDEISPNLFSWDVKSVPMVLSGYRPTAHVIIDSTKTYPDKLQIIEAILYGTSESSPRVITLDELSVLDTVTIVDNEDGTFTITGPDAYIYPIGEYLFEMNIFGIRYIDANSYTLSNS
jgi:hypothetical protein